MSLIDQIREDMQDIMSGDAAIDITVITDSDETFTMKAFHAKHHLGINPETGTAINSKKASIAFHENNSPVSIRKNDEVNLKNWRIRAKDSTGITKLYKAEQWFPDETVGVIVVIMSICAD